MRSNPVTCVWVSCFELSVSTLGGFGGTCARTAEALTSYICSMTLAAHPWYYCVDDGGEIVQDVWVPWKGW